MSRPDTCRTASPTIHGPEMGGRDPTGKPFVRRGAWYTALQFTDSVTQSRMYTWWPDRLQVGYTRTMFAALLVQPRPRRIGIFGLGGGSQAKFCHRYLRDSHIEVCERNVDVLALRDVFHIPPDSERFTVICADAARLVRQRRECYDLILLDAYDVFGIPPSLSTQAFYDACREALSPAGILAMNLYSTNARRHIARLRKSFEGRMQVLDEPHDGNRVVFAWREQARAHDTAAVFAGWPWSARRQIAPSIRRFAGSLERRP